LYANINKENQVDYISLEQYQDLTNQVETLKNTFNKEIEVLKKAKPAQSFIYNGKLFNVIFLNRKKNI